MNSKKIKFSVIIILYNQMKYVGDCIQSVINQTYPVYELIIVNDGSTDGGGAYVREWAEKYPDLITVYDQENAGAFVARATGMKHVTGDYFIVVDSDDMLRSDALNLAADRITATNAELLLINISEKADFSVPLLDYKAIGISPDSDGKVERGEYLVALSSSCAINGMYIKFYMTNLIDMAQIDKYGKGVKQGEDRIHTLILSDKAERIALLDECLYYYRPNPDSVCHVFNPYNMESAVKYCQVSRIYATRWFDEAKAKTLMDDFEFEEINARFWQPFSWCHSWREIRHALKIAFENEYACNVLKRKLLEKQSWKKSLLLKAFVNKNYFLLYCIYMRIKLAQFCRKIG